MRVDAAGVSKTRLLGKRATNREVAAAILKLHAGDGIAPPKTKTEIAAALNISRPTVDKYLTLARELDIGKPAVRAGGAALPDDAFTANPYVAKWVDHMKTRSRSGKAFGGMARHVRMFKILCDTLNVSPETWIAGATHDEVLEQGRQLMRNFTGLYMEKKAALTYPPKWRADRVNPVEVSYRYAKVARDFIKITTGYQYPTGESGVMSASGAMTHGNYADVRIPADVHAKIKADLMKEHGLDSDAFRFYMFGMEAFPRLKALFGARAVWREITLSSGRLVFEMEVYESKADHYKKGIWKKHIFDRELQDSIRQVAKRGGEYIIEDRNFWTATDRLRGILKGYYRKYGLTAHGRKVPNDAETSYFLTHAVHSLRHAGAQMALARTGWNLAYVAARGWKKTQELIDSYGEMPAEMELKAMEMIE